MSVIPKDKWHDFVYAVNEQWPEVGPLGQEWREYEDTDTGLAEHFIAMLQAMAGAAPTVHTSEVTCCNDCPFLYDCCYCVHPSTESKGAMEEIWNTKRMPDWCPLRAGATLVRMKAAT